jgi:dTMP kinase
MLPPALKESGPVVDTSKVMENSRSVPLPGVKERKAGLLIVFEGSDGSGKTTQRKLFRTWLQNTGEAVTVTKWNSSTLFKPVMRARKAARALTPIEFAILQAADFRHRLHTEIMPSLKEGKIVLADRYVFTGIARDVARGLDRDWSMSLYAPIRWPDMVFYFSASPQTCATRISGTRGIKYYEAGQDVTGLTDPFESYLRFASNVIDEYSRLSQEFAFITVDAERSIYEQHRFIRDAYEQKYGALLQLPRHSNWKSLESSRTSDKLSEFLDFK